MAFFDPTRRASGSILAGRMASFMTRPFGALTDWNERRATRKALANLSDQQLDDIGLCRGDIAMF